jgi:hypothetical protein
MTIPSPKIDSRTYADLVAETERLAQQLSPWKPPIDGKTDAGRALIRIFGRIAIMVVDRLNRVPEKHFLAFLNLIGTQQQPPRPARVPLTAYLVDNSPVDGLVPAGTQIAVPPPPGETEDILFETEQDLVVVRSQLEAAIVCQGEKYAEYPQEQIANASENFPIFEIESFTVVSEEENPDDGFYLRFDRPFPNQAIALYLPIAPHPPGVLRRNPTPPSLPAKLQWEYSMAEGWRSLSFEDGTQNLRQRGMVQFVGPSDFAPQKWFGRSGYWLRLRRLEGEFQIQPQLEGILTNTVWATQATTHQNEVLGSGTGDPHLVLHTLYAPVLPGQQLWVREAELPSAEEQIAIEKLGGENAIAVTPDAAGQPEEIWVRWHEVSDFYGSGRRDRHYRLDRMTGEIRFGGDGQGLAPPLGRNNIRMARYQSGGGRRGNCAVATLTELKTTVPYVDRVTNLEAAGGGADLESIVAVQQSGPNIEDLTYAASSDIARVKVLPPPQFTPPDLLRSWISPTQKRTATPTALPGLAEALGQAGRVQVLIVPHSDRQQPVPSLALIAQVRQFLNERIAAGVSLEITEPAWIQVTVTATVMPISLAVSNSLQAVVQSALTRFLHPLTGGTREQGWAFGRSPHLSDLYAQMERIAGVSHVEALNIVSDPPLDSLPVDDRHRFLIYSGQHEITIGSPP